jgi:hypothetical protein
MPLPSYPIIDPPETWWMAKRNASAPTQVPGVFRITKNEIYVRCDQSVDVLPKIRRNSEYFPTWAGAHRKLCEWLEKLIEENKEQIHILSEEITMAQGRLFNLRAQDPPDAA